MHAEAHIIVWTEHFAHFLPIHHNAGMSHRCYLFAVFWKEIPTLRLLLDAFCYTAGFGHEVESLVYPLGSVPPSECLWCASVACFISLCCKKILSVFKTHFSVEASYVLAQKHISH